MPLEPKFLLSTPNPVTPAFSELEEVARGGIIWVRITQSAWWVLSALFLVMGPNGINSSSSKNSANSPGYCVWRRVETRMVLSQASQLLAEGDSSMTPPESHMNLDRMV